MAVRKPIVMNAGRLQQLQAADTLALAITAADLPGGNWIGAQSGAATGSFTLNAANGTYQDTGIAVLLPAAGTYLLVARVRSTVAFSAGTQALVVSKFRDTTSNADVSGSETTVNFHNVINSARIVTITMASPYTAPGAVTVKIFAYRDLATTWTSSTIDTGASGRTEIDYVRIY